VSTLCRFFVSNREKKNYLEPCSSCWRLISATSVGSRVRIEIENCCAYQRTQSHGFLLGHALVGVPGVPLVPSGGAEDTGTVAICNGWLSCVYRERRVYTQQHSPAALNITDGGLLEQAVSLELLIIRHRSSGLVRLAALHCSLELFSHVHWMCGCSEVSRRNSAWMGWVGPDIAKIPPRTRSVLPCASYTRCCLLPP